MISDCIISKFIFLLLKKNKINQGLVQMLNLPIKFLLKNEGGGCISNSTSESYFLSVNMAK